jgi:mono/diheme cytochrome c family protein
MNRGMICFGALVSIAGAVSIGCSSDTSSAVTSDSGAGGGGGTGGAAGGKGGASTGGAAGGKGGTSQGGGGAANGGGGGGAGRGGQNGGADGGPPDASPEGGGQTDGGDAGVARAAMIARGAYLVRSVSLCGGCHTASGGQELAGNPLFKSGALPTPNLTPDPTGLGNWTDQQIIGAIRNGVDDQGRHLDSAMPYWLFHNMSDADAAAIVAFLRSLPAASRPPKDGSTDNPNATPLTPLTLAAFPQTSLPSSDSNYAAAETGRYLLAGAAQCVRCHSPSGAGLPAQSYFSGVAPTSGTQIFAPNITPDVTGISGWTAADVATALKVGTNKAGTTLCGSMPSGSKGYGGFTDADANAIGVYLTTIPPVSNAAANPSLEPACP